MSTTPIRSGVRAAVLCALTAAAFVLVPSPADAARPADPNGCVGVSTAVVRRDEVPPACQEVRRWLAERCVYRDKDTGAFLRMIDGLPPTDRDYMTENCDITVQGTPERYMDEKGVPAKDYYACANEATIDQAVEDSRGGANTLTVGTSIQYESPTLGGLFAGKLTVQISTSFARTWQWNHSKSTALRMQLMPYQVARPVLVQLMERVDSIIQVRLHDRWSGHYIHNVPIQVDGPVLATDDGAVVEAITTNVKPMTDEEMGAKCPTSGPRTFHIGNAWFDTTFGENRWCAEGQAGAIAQHQPCDAGSDQQWLLIPMGTDPNPTFAIRRKGITHCLTGAARLGAHVTSVPCTAGAVEEQWSLSVGAEAAMSGTPTQVVHTATGFCLTALAAAESPDYFLSHCSSGASNQKITFR
ncbi:MAG TPA: hypothetical protein VHK88_07445 [Aquihabitans sp.]|jgi:hypothetical protein|nr:hypothetical protein [Aquihabitans sp.]